MGVLNDKLSEKTSLFGLKVWVVLGIAVGAFIGFILLLSLWLSSRRSKSRKIDDTFTTLHNIPNVSKEIQEVRIDKSHHYNSPFSPFAPNAAAAPPPPPSHDDHKLVVRVVDDEPVCVVVPPQKKEEQHDEEDDLRAPTVVSVDESVVEMDRGVFMAAAAAGTPRRSSFESDVGSIDSRSTVPEVSHLGWGHWYTLRDLDVATNGFAPGNVIGEGGYGVVYRGRLPDDTLVAVKNLINNKGQAEREFRVEVEAIGRVRHKNLVRLLGYCVEGNYRMLVYEYVDNGNLEQWLHGPVALSKTPGWDARMKIVLGTAKALAYLHEALEPKVVHRDIKASNILLDSRWNSKVSDFGLAKLLGSEKSHVTTRVMGTFGYVAPEYANTGLLNERSDVYSFGVLLMEVVTGRDPVDYARPAGEVNLVDWLKMMVGSRRSDEVADPRLEEKPSPRALKRALLIALRCVDPDAGKRPRMGHVVHMLEAEEFPFQDGRKVAKEANRTKQTESQNQMKMVQSLSKEVQVLEQHGSSSGDAHESPMNKFFMKRWRKYEVS
ncbi:probable serine/threonine-protein kinase At1g01540 [Selaginella moellendorffii]|uniref:probable serine/threonine-protein kinase At1g01540 n=1 Tax=Selaginella moellendorffii TaxID=88036 RepID=UPI000D1CA130|nr:probable serine/threonine-protein kinase At1g01540 [Selaginella moellendorffii]|eukprot:XP_024537158.1 probable serine/threonine-protein kinase At1g01540 [Selaginella moellendorffii]